MNLSAPPLIILTFFLFFFEYDAASAEVDGSLGDSDGLKESGSKKRYTIFYSFSLSLY